MNAERDDDATMPVVDAAYRAASATLDEGPDARVRAAVLAAAARAVDARPRDVDAPFASRRRTWSIAALLVVSVGVGLVAMHAVRERPELVAARTPPVLVASGPPLDSFPAGRRVDSPAARRAPPSDMRSETRPAREPSKPIARDPGARVAAPARLADARTPNEAPTQRPDAAAARPFAKPASPVATEALPSAAPTAADALPPAPIADATSAAGATVRAKRAAPSGDATANVAAGAPASSAPSSSVAVVADADARAKTQASAEDDVDDDPSRWAARIAALRALGRDDEADRELARLRARHPAFVVPRDALRGEGTR